MQAWSYATSANNDGLQSAIVSILALLLKTISTILALREFGLELCRTTLQQTQLKLISRGVAAVKQKEHVISPCLRLLTEVTSFDGGAMARRVWAARTFTFDGKMMARNLAMWRPLAPESRDNKQRPSVRLNTVRYVLTHFKFQSSLAKADLLKHGNVLRSLFEHLKTDSPTLIQEVLDNTKSLLLMDASIPRINKSYLLNEHNLCNIANIYRHEQIVNLEDPNTPNPQTLAHEFLRYACTTPGAGALRPYAGWYPPGTDKEVQDQDQQDDSLDIDLGLSSVDWYEKYHGHVPVRNSTLAALTQFLRPYASTLESELLIHILKAAPELTADYFFKKSGFAFDPKLTATWIGYSAFLFNTVQLPVPEYFGRRGGYGAIPPPASIVIESILPQPLTQKVLTRCLNQQTELITFFALRILIKAFQKFAKVLVCFREAAVEHGTIWEEGADRLMTEFVARCPLMKDVVGTFRKTANDKTLQREACLRLLVLYYQLLPGVALEEKFDVSVALAEALSVVDDEQADAQHLMDGIEQDLPQSDDRLNIFQLNHLLQIARRTPDMRWWHKPDTASLSTFTATLKVFVQLSKQKPMLEMQRLLASVVQEHDILQDQTKQIAFSALVASLSSTGDFEPTDALYGFLDDAFSRLTRKPIKYQDDLDKLAKDPNAAASSSLLHMVLLEQWPFQLEKESAANIASWLSRFIEACKLIGEDRGVMKKVSEQLHSTTKNKSIRKQLSSADTQALKDQLVLTEKIDASSTTPSTKESSKTENKVFEPDPSLLSPPQEDPKHSGLHRWQNKDISTAILSGDLSSLIVCLSSSFPEVRKAAHTNLLTFMSKLARPAPETKPDSEPKSKPVTNTTNNKRNKWVAPSTTTTPAPTTFPEAHQYHLLIGILTTTALPYVTTNTPLPYLITTYAATVAAQVLHDPLHPMYERVCRFHTRAPKWDVERLASWWVHQVLYTPAPISGGGMLSKHKVHDAGESGDGTDVKNAKSEHHAGLLFVINYIFAALRTPTDLDILRQRGTFEPLLAIAADPYCERDVYEGLLRILWRVSGIEGGSTTLITRKGVLAWLGARMDVVREGKGEEVRLGSVLGLRGLMKRLWETCDQERVKEWSRGTIQDVLGTLGVE